MEYFKTIVLFWIEQTCIIEFVKEVVYKTFQILQRPSGYKETSAPLLYQVKFPENSGNNTIPDP
ncbi:hypothetical protein BHR79_05910 [Methanohalophilus halophilus]|uniref:Uncharacterized protein n=1 Tax=Methanohalophilus halophilus TaxID=2177 RepID=A0A1L3Q2F8_9EURY|nr:hypothetical protein [Methanohalophilus halophilus]APH39066.1 hypothetical protein BHR79_05910 [Methanohalophilus halophilus]